MLRLTIFAITCLLFQACTNKEDLSIPRDDDGFPSVPNALPLELAGKWIRTTSLRTFDFKPDEWVSETIDSAHQKFMQFNANKTYSSNVITCSECRVELLQDTLYVKHSQGFYKFPVLLLNDSLLYLKTNIGQPAYSLPNTGLFDLILEEKYRKSR